MKCKKELGKQIETLRKECGVSTYELEKKGIHPSLQKKPIGLFT